MPHFGGAESLMDILGEVFGGMDIFGGGQRRRGPRRGRDLEVLVELDLVEAYRGVKKTLGIPREELCPTCQGSGAGPNSKTVECRACRGQGAYRVAQGFIQFQQTCDKCSGRGKVLTEPCGACRGNRRVRVQRDVEVEIPPGVDTDMVMRVEGQGEAGDPGARSGDLHCRFRVRQHALFNRDNLDLHCEMPITFSQAALGSPLEAPTLAGKVVPLTLKRGAQHGDEIRVTGLGMPNVRGGRPGDLVVHLRVVTPTSLSKRQEELLRELAEIDHHEVSPERKSWFGKLKDFLAGPPGSAPAKGGG
jgi:molecular chaperone DnaJ